MGLIRFIKSIPDRIANVGGWDSLAGKAIGWLGTGLRILGIVSPDTREKLFPVDQGIMRLIKLESKHADAQFWSLTDAAAKANKATLIIDGREYDYKPSAMYGAEFKAKWFDRWFKEPLVNLRRLFDANDNGVIDWLEVPNEGVDALTDDLD